MKEGLCNKELDLEIGIGYIPYRAKICLVMREGNKEVKLATFNNIHAAELFMEKLKELVGYEGTNVND